MPGMMARVLMANSAGLYPPMRGSTSPRRKRRVKAKRAAVRRVGKVSRKRPARLKKGSAAAKAYMAKIRRKRRK